MERSKRSRGIPKWLGRAWTLAHKHTLDTLTFIVLVHEILHWFGLV